MANDESFDSGKAMVAGAVWLSQHMKIAKEAEIKIKDGYNNWTKGDVYRPVWLSFEEIFALVCMTAISSEIVKDNQKEIAEILFSKDDPYAG